MTYKCICPPQSDRRLVVNFVVQLRQLLFIVSRIGVKFITVSFCSVCSQCMTRPLLPDESRISGRKQTDMLRYKPQLQTKRIFDIR
jgi:hypothetical protein